MLDGLERRLSPLRREFRVIQKYIKYSTLHTENILQSIQKATLKKYKNVAVYEQNILLCMKKDLTTKIKNELGLIKQIF